MEPARTSRRAVITEEVPTPAPTPTPTPRRGRRALLAGLAALVVLAIASALFLRTVKAPTITTESARFHGVSREGIEYAIDLRCDNPNLVGLDLVTTEAVIFVEEQRLGSAEVLRTPLRLAARSPTRFRVLARADYGAALGVVATALQQPSLRYRVEGHIQVTALSMRFNVPFTAEGQFPREALLRNGPVPVPRINLPGWIPRV